MEVGAGKNFAVIAKFCIQQLFCFQGTFQLPKLFYKKVRPPPPPLIFIPFPSHSFQSHPYREPPCPELASRPSRPKPPVPCTATAPSEPSLPGAPLCPKFTLHSHAQPSPGLHHRMPVPALLPCWFRAEPHYPDSLSPAATSPLSCPEPWSAAPLRRAVHCRRLPLHRALLCPCCTTRPQPWSIPMEAIATGLGSSSVPLRETVLAPPRLQRLTLRARLQSHHLHWPQLLYQRSLRFLSPHPGDIRPGWDLRPLL